MEIKEPPYLIWVSQFLTAGGFAAGGRGMSQAFHRSGLPIGIKSMDYAYYQDKLHARKDFIGIVKDLHPGLAEQQEYATAILRDPLNVKNCVFVHNNSPHSGLIIKDGLNISRSMFECSGLPWYWIDWLIRYPQEVWSPSAWGAEIMAKCGIPEDRIQILPEHTDFELFDPANPMLPEIDLPQVPEDHKIFLSVFCIDSNHKDWRCLIRGWQQAFGKDDGVCLLIKTYTSYPGPAPEERMNQFIQDSFSSKEIENMAPIRFLDQVMDDLELAGLYRAVDAYVLPSHGEGWGRPFMEALSMGLPTIGPDWGGSTEFMDKAFSWPLGGETVPVDIDNITIEATKQLYSGQKWFQVDYELLAQAFQEINQDWDKSRSIAAQARPTLQAKFGEETIAHQAYDMAMAAYEKHSWKMFRPVSLHVTGRWNEISNPDSTHNQTLLESSILELANREQMQAIGHAKDVKVGKKKIKFVTRCELTIEPMILFTNQTAPASKGLQIMIMDQNPKSAESLKEWVDLFITDQVEIRDSLLQAAIPPERIKFLQTLDAQSVISMLKQLPDDALPIHSIRPARVEEREEYLATLYPDWSNPIAVFEQLNQWCRAIRNDHPVTLALYGSPEEQENAQSVISQWLQQWTEDHDLLPDITLLEGEDFQSLALASNWIIKGKEPQDSWRLSPAYSIQEGIKKILRQVGTAVQTH